VEFEIRNYVNHPHRAGRYHTGPTEVCVLPSQQLKARHDIWTSQLSFVAPYNWMKTTVEGDAVNTVVEVCPSHCKMLRVVTQTVEI